MHRADRRPEVEAVDEREVSRRGDDKLALGVGEVPGEFVASVGGVGTDDDGADQRCSLEPEEEVDGVVKEDGDMERPRLALGEEPCAAGGCLADRLGVGQGAVGGQDAWRLVLRQRQDERCHRVLLNHPTSPLGRQGGI